MVSHALKKTQESKSFTSSERAYKLPVRTDLDTTAREYLGQHEVGGVNHLL